MKDLPRRHHDVGGTRLPDRKIDRTEKADAAWQVAFTATLWALIGGEERRMSLDEMRRLVEDLSPDRYDAMPYYDRQTLAVASAAIERGYFSREELESRIADLAAAREPDSRP